MFFSLCVTMSLLMPTCGGVFVQPYDELLLCVCEGKLRAAQCTLVSSPHWSPHWWSEQQKSIQHTVVHQHHLVNSLRHRYNTHTVIASGIIDEKFTFFQKENMMDLKYIFEKELESKVCVVLFCFIFLNASSCFCWFRGNGGGRG